MTLGSLSIRPPARGAAPGLTVGMTAKLVGPISTPPIEILIGGVCPTAIALLLVAVVWAAAVVCAAVLLQLASTRCLQAATAIRIIYARNSSGFGRDSRSSSVGHGPRQGLCFGQVTWAAQAFLVFRGATKLICVSWFHCLEPHLQNVLQGGSSPGEQ
jgi:hypothetical protein